VQFLVWGVAAVAAVSAFGIALQSWKASLSVRVIDSLNGTSLPDARVELFPAVEDEDAESRSADVGTAREPDAVARTDSGGEVSFGDLEPGAYLLRAEAAHYVSATQRVDLRRGRNRLPQPLRLTGLEIPELHRFTVTERLAPRGFVLELQALREDGSPITSHPTVPMLVAARVSKMKHTADRDGDGNGDGAETREPTRGEVVYAGFLDWEWNDSPGVTHRYEAQLPFRRVGLRTASTVMAEYLLIMPKQAVLQSDTVEQIYSSLQRWSDAAGFVRRLRRTEDFSALVQRLRRGSEQIYFFSDTSYELRIDPGGGAYE
jgi:hypothetical protein